MNFKSLGLSDSTIKLLKNSGIYEPTPIQQEAIPPILNGLDVIGQAQTGTGKTLAFLLPLIQKMNPKLPFIQTLILAPTRELALQITESAQKFMANRNLNLLAIYGGTDIPKQLKKLEHQTIHLIVATPGRLLDYLLHSKIQLKHVQYFVLDEADQMLFMGFKNEVDSILRQLPKKRQTLFFSATMDSKVKKLAYHYTRNPQLISIETKQVTLEGIRQEVVETTDRHKQEMLLKALDEDQPFLAIIFCRTKRRANTLYEALKSRKYHCAILHSDIPQAKRERTLKAFKAAKLQYLVATDVAARGLDITGLTHIYNYDIPKTSEDYIHRIGRTGRAGQEGYTCVFIDPKNLPTLERIEDAIQMKLPRRSFKL